ncbi:MAG: CRISPR-associated endonuclease Cas1 [Bacteroidetes bacterium]|nr:MAG: CRISPR-associated endonuclease Cas1 [Bacteroidota bacterium]
MQLVTNTYGTYVHVKDELFEVRLKKDGKQEKHHVASQKVTSIHLSKGAAISTDAIILAVKNNIDIVVFEYDGTPIGRFWHSKLGSTTKIRKRQLEASLNEKGSGYARQWITQKIGNQADFLKRLKKHRPQIATELENNITFLENQNKKIEALEAGKIDLIADTIRGLEGTSGRIYFKTLSGLLARKYQFEGRSSRPATDQYNAFLNYAYGILYSRVEKALIIAGVDPYVGFMHRDDYNMKSMVFDFIEPYRIIADEVIFKLFSAKKVNDGHTDKITNGLSLNAEGKNLLVQHFFRFFEDDKIRYKGRNQSRANALLMDAHTFANELINPIT